MTKLTRQHSIQTENQEARLAGNGSYKNSTMTVYNNKIYNGDGRAMPLREKDVMINLDGWSKKQIYGASGETDKIDGLKIYGPAWYDNYVHYEKIQDVLDQYPSLTPNQVAISGAAGEESITGFEAVRKAATIAGDISGQQRILENLNAINIAQQVNTQDFKLEFLRKTSAVNSADKEIADDQLPSDITSVFAVGTHELFADATSYQTNLRDKDLKVDVAAEIRKEIPGMFAQAKEDKVITLVNAITGTNQGDWDAFTDPHYTTDAAADVQVGEDAIDAYGGTHVALMNTDTWRLYVNNTKVKYGVKEGNVSTSGASAKSGFLVANPGVQYYINDSITSQTYVLAAKESYMKYIQGMVINSSFKDTRTAGQTEWTFNFDFNGFFENETSAVFKGTSVGA